MAGMLSKLWDDVAGGSPPDKGMKQLRKSSSANNANFPDVPGDPARDTRLQRKSESVAIKKKPQRLNVDTHEGTPSSLGSTPPASPSMVSPSYPAEKDNIWRSVFHPGQNKVMRKVGSEKFDKAQPNSPSVYDWVVITALEG